MNPIVKDLRELELRICGKLDEEEQLELHNLITCVEQKVEALQELTNDRWERI